MTNPLVPGRCCMWVMVCWWSCTAASVAVVVEVSVDSIGGDLPRFVV
jgi:hypothetical protein